MCDGCKIRYVGTGETCYYCANRPNQGPVEPTPQDKPEDRSTAGAAGRLAAVLDSMDRLRKLSAQLTPNPPHQSLLKGFFSKLSHRRSYD